MRMTALSAGSRTSPDADLERLTRWCLAKFQGRVSPGKAEEHSSLLLSSDADLSRRRGRAVTDIACNKFSNTVRLFGIHDFLDICCQCLDSILHHRHQESGEYLLEERCSSLQYISSRVNAKAHWSCSGISLWATMSWISNSVLKYLRKHLQSSY